MEAKIERRCYTSLEIRTAESENDVKIIEGHPAVFGQITAVDGWFNEVIDSGAFEETDMNDVPLLVNHDMSKLPLARSNSTMTLETDTSGLFMQARLDTENNSDAKQLYSAVQRGDIKGMSFAFKVGAEEWENLETDMPLRRIKKISKLFDVSAVTYPQYTETDINARDSNTGNAENILREARRKFAGNNNEIEIQKLKNKILGGF